MKRIKVLKAGIKKKLALKLGKSKINKPVKWM
jgi:hypothetical protein